MYYWPKRLQIGFDAALFLLLCHQFPLVPAAHVQHPLLLCSLWTVNPTFCDIWCVTVKMDKKRNDLLILNWTLVKIWLKLTCFLKNVLSFYSLLLLPLLLIHAFFDHERFSASLPLHVELRCLSFSCSSQFFNQSLVGWNTISLLLLFGELHTNAAPIVTA